ncbi:MAG: hypothetical protein H0T89_17325 [Deltaproteobacteria bacterium]|nr:hypothetical protein [Deltaproteobacteria bacterium]
MNLVHRWSLHDGAAGRTTLRDGPARVRRVQPGRAFIAFADEGRALITLDNKAGWTRWDVATGRALARIHRLGGSSIQYSPDGAHVGSCSLRRADPAAPAGGLGGWCFLVAAVDHV